MAREQPLYIGVKMYFVSPRDLLCRGLYVAVYKTKDVFCLAPTHFSGNIWLSADEMNIHCNFVQQCF
jgi:hypothetical protein